MTKSTITREPITHDIKIYPEFFSAVCTGVKRAELRKNDRDYRVGDTLHLMETPRGSCHQTGEFINVKITHIADVGEWMPGYVLLSVELQERRKAEKDSEPVAYMHDGEDGTEYNGHNEFSGGGKGIPLYRHAQSAPVVPDDVLDALQKVARILLDLNDFDGDRRGIADCLGDAEEALIEVVNRRAAMLAAAPQPQNAPQNIPEIIPDCWCRTCRPVVLNDMRFVVCPDCGNKRCPRANDHRNACTGSNQPGQEGSAYPAAPQEDINALIPLVSRNEREGK